MRYLITLMTVYRIDYNGKVIKQLLAEKIIKKGEITMKIAIFAINRQTKEGRKYVVYTGRIRSKSTGEQIGCRIKFTEDAGDPKPADCPMYINVEKDNANLAEKHYIDEASAERKTSYTLWVKSWTADPEPYVDHSLDDYE